MTKIRRIFLIEDAQFRHQPEFTSYVYMKWLAKHLKIRVRVAWVSHQEKFFENLIEALAWLRAGDCLVLSFHGSPGSISISNGNLSLEEVADFIDGRGERKKLLISSCEVIRTSPEKMDTFKRVSGFYQTAGYVEPIYMKRDFRFEREFLLNWLSD